jgi:phosphoglycerol transferase MdoB-like AlkP superfamily enzyme
MRKARKILLLFLFLLAIYFALRIAFYFFYFSNQIHLNQLPSMLFWGTLIDLSGLAYLHFPFFIYYFFIHELFSARTRAAVAVTLLFLSNVPFLAVNILDLAYFRFTRSRSTSDLFTVWTDSLSSSRSFIEIYWPYIISFVACAVIATWVFYVVFGRDNQLRNSFKIVLRENVLSFFVVATVAGICARGLAAAPIMPYTPLLYFSPQYQPLVANSTVSFLYSVAKHQNQLKKRNYRGIPPEQLRSARKQFVQDEPFSNKNIVIFILESFCKEYLEDGSAYRCKTPFLDSIIAQSTWYSSAYSNGLTSNHSVMSLLASLPSFTDEPYYYSVYSRNRIRGVGQLLKEKGYSTHFFMGAGPDHFGFGKACKILGIESYHFGPEVKGDNNHDGNWGVYDHKFLPYAASVLKNETGPFFSVVYNLSSHPPFKLPPEMSATFEDAGKEPFMKSTAYVDYSLGLFFGELRKSPLFEKTVFYFIADHSIIHVLGEEERPTSVFGIPFFVFDPSSPAHREESGTVQQIDLLPTILDRLHYEDPFLAFGRSLQRPGKGFMISRYYNQDTFVFYSDSLELAYNGRSDEPVYLFDLRKESQKRNLVGESSYRARLDTLVVGCRAFLQEYSDRVINDRLYVK